MQLEDDPERIKDTFSKYIHSPTACRICIDSSFFDFTLGAVTYLTDDRSMPRMISISIVSQQDADTSYNHVELVAKVLHE